MSRAVILSVPIATLLVAFRMSAGAASYTWDANGTTAGAQDGGGNWGVGTGNWFDTTDAAPNVTWSDGNDAVFGAASGAAGTVTMTTPVTTNSITFNAPGSGTYTISGSAANPITNTTGNITTATGVSAIMSAVLGGSSGLTKAGTGTLTLSGASANTYTGTTIVNAGTLTLAKTAGVNAVTGDIQVNTGGLLTLGADNQIADTSTINIAGTGSANFVGHNETFTNLTMTGGTFLTGNNGTPANTSTVAITGTVSLSGSAAVTLNSGGTINAQAVTMSGTSSILLGGNVFTELIVGSGGLSLSGETISMNMGTASNRITLNGDVTASGGNNIQPGTGTASAGTINELALGAATRTFNITSGTTNVNVVLSGSSGANLIKSGAGTLSLGGTTANTYSGAITINAGVLALNKTAGVNAINSNITVSGGTLVLSQSNQIADTSSITISSGAFNLNGNSETFQSLTSAGAFSNTTGTATISGNVSMTGGTFSASSTSVGATSVGGNVTAGGGAVTNGSGTFNIAGGLTLSGGTFGSGAGTTNITGTVNVTGGPASAFTVNSGGIVNVGGIVVTGSSLLLGGSAASVTTLTIGSGGLSLSGQTVQTNPAGTGQAGTEIVLNGPLTASGANNFTLSGSGVVTAGSVDEIILGSAMSNFNITGGQTNISLSLVGANTGFGLAKNGAGTLGLLNNNSYNGATVVNGGVLAVSSIGTTQGTLTATPSITVTGDGTFQDGSSVATTNDSITNRVNTAATLTLGGSLGSGTFTQEFGTVSASQTLASLNIQQGADVITPAGTAAGVMSLTFTGDSFGGGYTRGVGGSVNFITQTGSSISFTNAPANSSVSGTGTDAILIGATLNGTDFITAQAGALTAAAYTQTGGPTPWAAGKNMDVTSSVAATAGTPINSLRFGTAGNFTVTLNGTQTIASGAILENSGVGANPSLITGGTLTSGSAAGDLIILQNNAAGTLTIASTIADNGSPVALTLAGVTVGNVDSGTISLTGTNTYTGQTFLNNGAVLSIGSNAALGSVTTGAQLNIDGGTLMTTSSVALDNAGANARNIVLDAGGGIFSPTGSGVLLTVNGIISGTGALTKNGTGTLTLNSANTFTGGSSLTNGMVQIGSDTALGTGKINLASANLQPTGGTRILANAITLLNSPFISGSSNLTLTGTFTINAANPTMDNLLASGSTLTLAGPVFLTTGTGAIASTVIFAGSGATVISGVVADNDSGKTPLAGITLNGAGSLELTGVNTYLGRTVTAGGGALIVHQDANFGTAPSSPMVDDVILAQTGVLNVANSFTLNSNRSVGIGTATGTATVGTVNVFSGQTFTIAGTVADRTLNGDGTSVSGTNTGSLTKTGAGTLALAGTNTYSGNTLVSAGTLIVSGSLSPLTMSNSPAVSAANGATLGLTGTGSISASTLSLSTGSTLSLQIGSLTSNTISLTGAATLSGTVTLALNLAADPTDGTTFTLISGGGPLVGYSAGARFAVGGTPVNDGSIFTVSNGGFTQVFQITYGDGSSNVTLTAVPEPQSWMMLSGLAGLLAGHRRLRRRKA